MTINAEALEAAARSIWAECASRVPTEGATFENSYPDVIDQIRVVAQAAITAYLATRTTVLAMRKAQDVGLDPNALEEAIWAHSDCKGDVIDCMSAALEAYFCAREAQGWVEAPKVAWRDMESAPMPAKGAPRVSVLLMWDYSDGSRHVGEAYWQDDGGGFNEGWWWANTSPGDYFYDLIENGITGHILAWMPMPEPPAMLSASQAAPGKGE